MSLPEETLPEEKRVFDRETWGLVIEWLGTGESGIPEKKEARERLIAAAARDPDVALVDAWRAEAEPLPEWALQLDRETPHWGVEICNVNWLAHLEGQIDRIREERAAQGIGWCGARPVWRIQWATWAQAALSRWLEGQDPEQTNPIGAEIHATLGRRDEDKAGAVSLLQSAIELAVSHRPATFEEHYATLETTSDLAAELRKPIGYLEFTCGYRWEKVVLDLCRAIGDETYRRGRPRSWHVGSCNGQIAFADRDDPLHIPTTAGILVGLWAWLVQASSPIVTSRYPEYAPLAAQIGHRLGESTPAKRWLAGRLFVGVSLWLQEYDRVALELARPALTVYPRLATGIQR
ncbi:MAG: hypothetical protein ACK2VD_17450 [Anaerolineae bacterium]